MLPGSFKALLKYKISNPKIGFTLKKEVAKAADLK